MLRDYRYAAVYSTQRAAMIQHALAQEYAELMALLNQEERPTDLTLLDCPAYLFAYELGHVLSDGS